MTQTKQWYPNVRTTELVLLGASMVFWQREDSARVGLASGVYRTKRSGMEKRELREVMNNTREQRRKGSKIG